MFSIRLSTQQTEEILNWLGPIRSLLKEVSIVLGFYSFVVLYLLFSYLLYTSLFVLINCVYLFKFSFYLTNITFNKDPLETLITFVVKYTSWIRMYRYRRRPTPTCHRRRGSIRGSRVIRSETVRDGKGSNTRVQKRKTVVRKG